MTKSLFLGCLISTLTISAQVLESENFNALPLGDVSTDITGATAGVGNLYTYTAAGANTDFQIAVIDAAHGNSLKLIGSATAANTRYVWKDDGSTTVNYSWPTRTAGNNILKGSLEIYTGAATGGVATARSYIYNYPTATSSQVLVGIGYNYATQKITGYAYGTSGTTSGTYAFSLGTATYPANTWVTVSYTFDYSTGTLTWTSPEGVFSPSATFTPGSANINPQEHDFLSTVGTGNTVSHDSAFDNLRVEATNAAALATKEATIEGMVKIEIYPNPTSDFVNVISDSSIKNIKVYDLSGKHVTGNSGKKQMDVRNLSKGIYIIKVETENGTQTLKFIKN